MVDLINPSLFGIVPATENKKKTQFYAWHRPRKQWVRVKQWQYWTNNSFVKDATSLLPTHNPVADEEVLCGIKIIDKISNASHIDDILEKNIELYNTLKQSILSLLDEAGYDIKCYPY